MRIRIALMFWAIVVAGVATRISAGAETEPTNAADLYRTAFAALPKGSSPDAIKIRFYWETPLDAQTDACLERLRAQLELFRKATSAGRCDWGPAIVGGKYASVSRS